MVAATGRLSLDALLAQPVHLGTVVVHHTAEVDQWTAPYEVLTQPEAGGVAVSVVDKRGEVRYAGHGTPVDGRLEVTLHAAARGRRRSRSSRGSAPAASNSRASRRRARRTAWLPRPTAV